MQPSRLLCVLVVLVVVMGLGIHLYMTEREVNRATKEGERLHEEQLERMREHTKEVLEKARRMR